MLLRKELVYVLLIKYVACGYMGSIIRNRENPMTDKEEEQQINAMKTKVKRRREGEKRGREGEEDTVRDDGNG